MSLCSHTTGTVLSCRPAFTQTPTCNYRILLVMIQITLMEFSFLCINAAACVRVSACVSARAGVIHMQTQSRLHPASQGCSPLRRPSLLRGRFSGERKDDGSRLAESERKCDVSPRQRQNLPCLFSEFKMNCHVELFSARCSWFTYWATWATWATCVSCSRSLAWVVCHRSWNVIQA